MTADFSLPPDFAGPIPLKRLELPPGFDGLLLHSCCAPCSAALLECLLQNGIRPTVFFYNPNIEPAAEYDKRRAEWLRLCSLLDLETVVGDYDTVSWHACVRGHEHDGERSRRCELCFTWRLTASARLAVKLGLGLFTTTLGTSRWKSKKQIDAAGRAAEGQVPGSRYWDPDWRKGGLIGRRSELVRAIGFYNQTYCGCAYSLAERRRRERDRAERLREAGPA